jgi:hypothetical protein
MMIEELGETVICSLFSIIVDPVPRDVHQLDNL